MDIKKVLKDHGWTISAVSNKLGITQSALSQQINNKSITFAKVEQISDITGIPLEAFVTPFPRHISGAYIVCPHCGKTIALHVDKH